jgi:hypothetical protein
MCKQEEDHLLLAEVAAWLAADVDGVVAVGGMLRLPQNHPGRIETLRSCSMVLDSEALWAWSRCNECRMIK